MVSAETQSVIDRSTFRFAGTYAWVSASAVRNPEKHFLVSRDDKETTVVTRPENLVDVDVVEENRDRWLLLSIDCANPFYCEGYLATISTPMAEAGIDILVVSTFTRDCIFVKEDEGTRAGAILEALGFTQV